MSTWVRRALSARRHQQARSGHDFEHEAASNVITSDGFEPDAPVKHDVHHMPKQGRKTACGLTDMPRTSANVTYVDHLVTCAACVDQMRKRAARVGLARTMGDVAKGRKAGGG